MSSLSVWHWLGVVACVVAVGWPALAFIAWRWGVRTRVNMSDADSKVRGERDWSGMG